MQIGEVRGGEAGGMWLSKGRIGTTTDRDSVDVFPEVELYVRGVRRHLGPDLNVMRRLLIDQGRGQDRLPLGGGAMAGRCLVFPYPLMPHYKMKIA